MTRASHSRFGPSYPLIHADTSSPASRPPRSSPTRATSSRRRRAHADVTKSEVDFAEASARVAAARVVKLETERDGAWQATRRSLATETAQGDQSLNLLSNATRRFEAIAQTVAAAARRRWRSASSRR